MKIIHKTASFSAFRKGFTLIELLVVIAIIAVLASVSFAPIMSFFDKGKITEIRNNFRMLETATTDFYEDYRFLPYVTKQTDDDQIILTGAGGKFLEVLMGKETGTDAQNDAGNVYLSMKEVKKGKNGIIFEGDIPKGLVDHWKNPYVICLDYNNDGTISKAGVNPAYASEDPKDFKSDTLIGATPGKNLTWGDKDVTSWE